jgi:hypothetical protein
MCQFELRDIVRQASTIFYFGELKPTCDSWILNFINGCELSSMIVDDGSREIGLPGRKPWAPNGGTVHHIEL